jgi:hypothetical protein
MTFLNPLALLGMIAASIPILLHLFNLRKLQTIEFSTLAFLKELQKTNIRKLKITQLILLVLRVLIVAFAVLAFARPAVKTSFPGLGAKAKSSVVILFDNSFSMEVADERGVRLKQAKDAALSILQTLGEGDEVAFVQMADLNDKRFFDFTRDFGMLSEELQKVSVSYTTAKLSSALRIASATLSSSKNLNREVFIITDAQKNILDEARIDSLKLFDASTVLYVIPIGASSKAGERNLSVDSLALQTSIFQPGKLVELEARIRNSGNEAVQGVIVSLVMNGERVAQRTVDIPASATKTITIAAAAPDRTKTRYGLVRGSVEVEGDVLDADNRRYFGFILPETPRLGVIGTPAETEFLRLALTATTAQSEQPSGAPARFTLSLLPPASLASANLNEFDALFAVGVPRFSSSDVARLQMFIQSGGSIFVFPGAESDIASYNSNLLPALQLGQATLREYPPERPGEFSTVDKTHPLFAGVFKSQASAQSSPSPLRSSSDDILTTNTGRGGVESPKILRLMPLVRESLGGQSIIEVPEGVFLAESTVLAGGNKSAGRAYYCAAPPTLGFGTFPVTGLFVTIVNRAATLMTTTPFNGITATVGEPISLSITGKYSASLFKILDPNNIESLREATVLPSGASLRLDGFRKPGVYSIQTQSSTQDTPPTTVQTLAVNPPASESAITAFSAAELAQHIADFTSTTENIRVIDTTQRFDPDALRAGAGTELWKFCLALAVVCAVAEMLIARRAVSSTQEVS